VTQDSSRFFRITMTSAHCVAPHRICTCTTCSTARRAAMMSVGISCRSAADAMKEFTKAIRLLSTRISEMPVRTSWNTCKDD